MTELKIGLEIHVQLNTGKLFCDCESYITDTVIGSFQRTLYPTSGELGKTDRAALFELSRGRIFNYAITDNSCLVEMDEEPPHPINKKAVGTALALSIALNCLTFQKISVMRKIVVDGSNTTGFQRTSLVGLNGTVKFHKRIGITSVCLEEDSARKISQDGNTVLYSLDRLGIPLIEISTEPDIESAEEAVDVARELGYMVMSTGMVKQGADSIRQDVNLSLGFGRVEIKGVSRLNIIKEIIEKEIERQNNLGAALILMKERGGFEASRVVPIDVTSLLSRTKSKIILTALNRKESIYSFLLPNLEGLLKNDKYKVGREVADCLKPFGVNGILHGDELPGYGITENEVKEITAHLALKENDSFALIAVESDRVGELIKVMNERIKKLEKLDFSETRAANIDGTTHYLRPLPGRERMYPETDIPGFEITKNLLKETKEIAPGTLDEQIEKMSRKYSISQQDSSTLIRNGDREIYEEICGFIDYKLAARILIHIVPQFERETNTVVERSVLLDLCRALSERGTLKLSLEPALRIINEEKKVPVDILDDIRIKPLSKDEILELINAEMSEEPEFNEKVMLSRLKKKSNRPLDPMVVMAALKEIHKA